MVIKRKRGSHYVLYGEGRRYAVVPKHPSKVVKKGVLDKILEGAQLTIEEFKRL